MNIFRNEKADKAAKYNTEYQNPTNIKISKSFIKKKLIKRSLLE
jgi:hypothetical protein